MIWIAAEMISPTNMMPTCTTFFIVSHTAETVFTIPSQTFWIVDVMLSQALVRKSLIPFTTVSNTFFMPSQTEVKKSVMPFHTDSTVAVISAQAVSRSVPNHPRNVSSTPFNDSNTSVSTAFMPSHIPPNTSCIPVQHCSQFPVNSPMNVSNIPIRTSHTVVTLQVPVPCLPMEPSRSSHHLSSIQTHTLKIFRKLSSYFLAFCIS